MPGLTIAYAVVIVPSVYLFAGAFGLLLTTVASLARSQGLPNVLRNVTGFWDAFRTATKATATWPWTWKKWTDA
jgi:hypothetical protein